MKLTLFACALVALLIASGSHAEPADPAAPVPVFTVRQLRQGAGELPAARVRGRIAWHEQGSRYTFADDTGRMAVEIAARRFPHGVAPAADQWLEIEGPVQRDWGQLRLKVRELRPLS